jgi:putative NADH-flavin reductase
MVLRVRVVVFGASGAIGRAITAELLARGHTVTGVNRTGAPVDDLVVQVEAGDARDPDSVAQRVSDADAVVSAVGPRRGVDDPEFVILGAAHGLAAGLRQAGVQRLVLVGGTGSLEIGPGQRLLDEPDFPAADKPAALAHAQAVEFFQGVGDLDWTYVSPADHLGPGARTGTFRVGGDELLLDEAGVSRISIPDLAIAVADEVEAGDDDVRRRITVAY